MRRLLVALVVALALFGGVTLWALEGQEVAVLRTTDDRGAPRETRVWIVDEGEHAWVEAATPERGFYRDVLARPEAELRRRGISSRIVATPVPGPEPHARLRAMLRAKYGLADRWVGLFQDTSRSVAVRLAPVS